METGVDAAVKVEKRKTSSLCSLDREADFLRRLPKSAHMPELLQFGVEAGNRYMLMNRLGPNVSDLRRRLEKHKFSYSTAVQVAMKMLGCLRTIHDSGLVHRDVKPSNCLVGLVPHHTTLVMVDFGLAKVYVTDTNEVIPAKSRADFRGTSLYASMAAHEGKDLGRKDDLWSLFFMLVDQTRQGSLPWRGDKKLPRAEVFELKRKYMGNLDDLISSIPHSHHLRAIATHLSSLSFEDEPNYDLLLDLMRLMLKDNGDSVDDVPDWVARSVYPREASAKSYAVPASGQDRAGAATAPAVAAAASTPAADRLITVAVSDVTWKKEVTAFATQWVDLVKPFLAHGDREIPDIEALEQLYRIAQLRPDLYSPELLADLEARRATLGLQLAMHDVERKLSGPVIQLKRQALKLKVHMEAPPSLRRPKPPADGLDDPSQGKRRRP